MSIDAWEQLSQRLAKLGWKPHSAGGFNGLMSPHDTLFVDDRAATGEGRERMIAVLRQRVSTTLDYKEKGFFPDEAKNALEDSQQLLECLLET
jgi:hypothetical protein